MCCRSKPRSFLQGQLLALTMDILYRVRHALYKWPALISANYFKSFLSLHVHFARQMCVYRAPKGISLSTFDLARARTTRYEDVSFQER